MGKVMSMVARKANRFNVENRAHRVLERDKPVPAPKFEGNLVDMQRTLELDPKFVENLNKKDSSLDSRLKNVYVTSKDGDIDYRNKKPDDSSEDDRSLPLNRTTPEDFEFGYREPERAAPGRYTLRQAMKFISDHQNDPEFWTAAKIADEYKLKEPLVANILKYFKTFSIHIPDKTYKEALMMQAKNKLLNDGSKQEKNSSGGGT